MMLLLGLLACTGLGSVEKEAFLDTDDDAPDEGIDTDPPAVPDTDPIDSTPLQPDDSDTPPPDTDELEETETLADTDPPDDSSAPPPWSAALTVDGTWDCPAMAEFGTTSTLPLTTFPRACVTWDADWIYLAWNIADVRTGGASHFLVAYIGNAATGVGTNQGVLYNSQQPMLIGGAFHQHVRWKADGSFSSRMTWSGTDWVDGPPGWLASAEAQAAESDSNEVVEWRMSRSALGLTHTLVLAAGWLYEGALAETTFGAIPANAFSDGYDPDFHHVWRFDLAADLAPGQYVPVP